MTIVCRVDECPWKQDRAHPMRVKDETARHWVFECPRCLNLRCIGKDRVGGTIGQGRHDDQPVPKYMGRGFHAV